MNRIGLIFLLTFFLSACMYGQKTEADFQKMLSNMYLNTVPLIYPKDLNEGNTTQYIFLDTREQEEFDVAHIQDAVCTGYDDFKQESLKNVPKDQPIIVYCSVGYRSERIGEMLQQMGYTEVYNLYGGIFQWKNEGNTVVDHQDQPTEKVHTYNRKWSKWLFNGEKVY